MSQVTNLKATPTPPGALTDNTRFEVYTERQFDRIEALHNLPEEQRFAMRVVANVLPFRVNQYVIDELIDWERVPEDPVFQLTFPQPGMLHEADFNRMAGALRRGAGRAEIKAVAREIQAGLNPHPAGQQQMNVPQLGGEPLPGVQHKYRETVLFFPSQGQVCHSYCTFCFRWAQFVGDKALRFAANEASNLHRYLAQYPAISDLLVTGGDPMVMKTDHLKAYLEPLVRAWEIYREAVQQVSGLGRTARGPSMSAGPGKVEVQGVTEIQGERVFVLRFIQGRDPDWVQ